MKKFNRSKFETETEEYLERNRIFEMFQSLTEQLVVNKPTDPLGFILKCLETPTCTQYHDADEIIVALSPPGSDSRPDLEDLLKNNQAVLLDFPKALNNSSDNLRLSSDSECISSLSQFEQQLKNPSSHIVLYGYPRTMTQIHSLSKRRIYPTKVILFNCEREECIENLEQEITSLDLKKTPQEVTAEANLIFQEYENRIKEIKEVYGDIVINARNRSEEALSILSVGSGQIDTDWTAQSGDQSPKKGEESFHTRACL